MKRIVLAGNAVTAQIMLTYLRADARYEVVGATVDDEYVAAGALDGVVSTGLSQLSTVHPPGSCSVLMAAGYDDLNRVRESLFARLKSMGYGIETYIHQGAHVHSSEPIGEGSVVLPGAVVEPRAQVGANTMLWCNTTLAHHCKVADNCWIAAGSVIAGQASVGRNSFVGINASIVDKVSVGEYNIIGAAALISRDTKAKSVHLSRSAEPFRYSSEDYVKHFGI